MARKIVDLKRSIWDKKKSDPSKGDYEFEKIVYYKNKDFKEGYIHPYKLKWCKYSKHDYPRPYASLESWKSEFKATLLTVGDDYWPEGIAPDAEGKYIAGRFGDLVAVKIPIAVHMAHRKAAKELADRQAKSVKGKFIADAKKAGIWSEKDEEENEDELDRMRKDAESLGL